MKQKEADRLAQALLNLQETFPSAGVDGAMVIANAAERCVERIKIDFPEIADAMNELEILRTEESA